MTLPPLDKIDPTPYPAINAILGLVLSNVKAVIGTHFHGMYLFGSLASGGFNPHSSDIDFVVVTGSDLPGELLSRLESMHAEIAASGLEWAHELEGFYIPRGDLRRYDPAQRFPSIGVDWDFNVGGQDSAGVIMRYILREQGIVLAGPPLRELIDPVTAAEIRQAATQILIDWWVPKLTDPAQLIRSDYQAYAVLTMCRMLYTLATGAVASKPAAARWALENHDLRWTPLIHRALDWQHGMEMDRLAEILDFIRYTYEFSQSMQAGPDGEE